MAEGFLRVLGNSGLAIHAESAGLEPGSLNPDVVTVMAQAGVDISQHRTKSVFELAKKAEQTGEGYDYIITVCDKEAAERCPIFPNPKSSTGKSEPAKRIHWSFRDPSAISKNESLSLEERQQEIAKIRDEIKLAIEEFIKSLQRVNKT